MKALEIALGRWEERRLVWERCFVDAGRKAPTFAEPKPIECKAPHRPGAFAVTHDCPLCAGKGWHLSDAKSFWCRHCDGHGRERATRADCFECNGYGITATEQE